jgi:hypothetical protein
MKLIVIFESYNLILDTHVNTHTHLSDFILVLPEWICIV